MSQFDEEELIDSAGKQNYVKLFVGQIPREMDEEALIPYFSEFGPIVELTVIRDRATKQHKGCAFVTYLEPDAAFQAIDQLHDKIKLGSAINPLQVRIAECQVERENKLFIGMLPKNINEEQLHDMFVKFGDLREVHVIRGPEGSSKGCAFVKFVDRDAATIAIHEMNNRIPDGSTRPLVVKFADVKKHGKRVDEEALIASMSIGRQSTNAMNNTNFQGLGGASGLSRQGRNIQSGNGSIGVAGMGGNSVNNSGNDLMMYSMFAHQTHQTHQTPPQQSQSQSQSQQASVSTPYMMSSQNSEDGEDGVTRPPEGPSGANLFIYHLPRDLTDADLATLFAPFGNVISAKVFVDKKTSDSKGFGFVSFDSVDSANAAISAMNGFQIGSKRLKVQHKRTHDGIPGTVGGSSPSPMGPSPSSLHIQPPLQLMAQTAALHSFGPSQGRGNMGNMGNMGSMGTSGLIPGHPMPSNNNNNNNNNHNFRNNNMTNNNNNMHNSNMYSMPYPMYGSPSVQGPQGDFFKGY